MTAWLNAAAVTTKEFAGLQTAIMALRQATDLLLRMTAEDAAAVATPFLQAFGMIAGGVMLAGGVARAPDGDFLIRKRKTLDFYVSHILPRYIGALATVASGAVAVAALRPEDF